MRDAFLRFAARVTALAGSPYALLLAALVIGMWLVTGPIFAFSDTWQLVINTATTIVTFLMVFVIQATTNREMRATQIKLDELIRAVSGARNAIIATDLIPEEEVDELQREFEQVAEHAQTRSNGANGTAHGNGKPNGIGTPSGHGKSHGSASRATASSRTDTGNSAPAKGSTRGRTRSSSSR